MHMQTRLATFRIVIDYKRQIGNVFLSGLDANVSAVKRFPRGIYDPIVIVVLVKVVIVVLQLPGGRYENGNLFEKDTLSKKEQKIISLSLKAYIEKKFNIQLYILGNAKQKM